MAMKYDRIGDGYDLTRRADPRITERLASLLDAAPGAPVLDVACGTGNYTFALEERGLAMVGGDLSQTMLARARQSTRTCPSFAPMVLPSRLQTMPSPMPSPPWPFTTWRT